MKKLSNNKLWELMRTEWKKWQKNAHEDDCMTLHDFADEYVGTTFHGAKVVRDNGGFDINFKY